MEDRMEREKKSIELKAGGSDAGKAQPKGKDDLDPCEKAFHQETARLEDSDEACDDGVR
jgi:hypothetical protein